MNNDEGMIRRRARLQALRERYEQPSSNTASSTLAAPMTDSVVPASGGRRGKGGRRGQRGQAEPGQRSERQSGGLLQRFAQFLMETPPGDPLIPGVPIGEQRLQQAIRLLEQRARTAPGNMGERIQRLFKFLRQDIPGEPMSGGINIWRLQQILDRVGQSPISDSATAPARMKEEPPLPIRSAKVALSPEEKLLSQPAEDNEIAAIEADLQRLHAVAQDLQARLDQARQRAGSASSVQPSRPIEPPVNRPPEPTTAPQSSGDDWFLEFLE